ncbi:MAG TPA: lipocalin-like domain-containing protein [Azoarcus taiwanensis]|nr:lipocalin-like domain-containing protein [Azoarcus taiwanensis]
MRSFQCLMLALGVSLAASAAERYPPVLPGKVITFPQDTGAHPDYRTEWWYITGWLQDTDGMERGFQVTFFRVRTLLGEDNPSRFAPTQLMFAHAALADLDRGRLLHDERVERALAPLAGAEEGRTRAWIGDWSLVLHEAGHYTTTVNAGDFGFDLHFDPSGEPVLNGKAGWSQKAPDPINASYYYSRPQLAVSGTLDIGAHSHAVSGHAWLDHEWSSEILPEDASGWDWIGVNLHDGGSLMAFQMRDRSGATMFNAGTLVEPGKGVQTFSPDEVRFQPLRWWASPRSGIRYPVAWAVEAGTRHFEIEPLMDDQELDSRASTGAIYWEGAIRLLEDGRQVGQGYLEMTGYGERLRM